MYVEDHKILFIHPQKCAGSTVRVLLRKQYPKGIEPKPNQHYRAIQWKEEIGDAVDNCYKIGVIRNPWDRAVSYFYHLKTHQDYKYSFEYLVNRTTLLYNVNFSAYCKYHIDGEYVIDYMIRQENISEDIDILATKLKFKEYTIDHVDHKTIRPDKNYRKYYTEKTRSQVEAACQWEINKFGYKF